jgi:cytochrome c oxidase subunit II
LAPHSPGTDQIHTLLWIGFIAAAILVVAINVALIYAVRRNRGERGAEPRQVSGARRGQFRVAGALTAFAVVVFVLGVIFTDRARETPATGSAGLASLKSAPLQIDATGQQWLWRYNYPNGAFSYYKLVVPVDTAVHLRLLSTDVVHTWNVPDLAGKHDAAPGKVNNVVFRADEEGSFDGASATLNGQSYPSMRTEVEVVSPEEYEAFVERQKTEIEEAEERVTEMIQKEQTP